MSFDPFSLDYFYYPVSAIMWLWYKAFAFLLGPSSFFAWTLSVMFLVFTLRAILYKPSSGQIRTTRQMQELQPQIKALQKKYGKDRQRMALEMQKLQREHGFNPDPRLLADAGAAPGVPRAVPRAAVLQPDQPLGSDSWGFRPSATASWGTMSSAPRMSDISWTPTYLAHRWAPP